MNKGLVDKLRRQEIDSMPSYRSASIEFKEPSTYRQAEQGQGTSILPNINQFKSELPTRARPSATIVGLQKHTSLRIKHPLFGDRGKEKVPKGKTRINRKVSSNNPVDDEDALYYHLQ